jgi:glycosyltransferase involved in cell wall biosynthesis
MTWRLAHDPTSSRHRRTGVAVLGIKTLPALAGADRVVERLLEHSHEVEYTVYLVKGLNTKQTCGDGRHYVYVPALPGKHLRAFSFFFLSSLHFLVRGSADVVHVHNSDFGLFCPLLRLKRAPIVGTFHGEPYMRAKWGRVARAYLRVSEWVFLRACHALTSVAVPPERWRRVVHIPNGIDPSLPDPSRADAFLSSIGLRGERFAFFACGRLDSTKGLHHVLAAYAASPGLPPLLVVGDFGHDEQYTSRIRVEAAKDPRVTLYGSLLDRATLLAVMSQSSVFVFPSEVEAMSMVLLEAVGSGTPAVVSDIAENRSVVGDDYPFLFKSADPDSLAQAFQETLEPTEDAGERMARSYNDAKSRFRWPAIAARYEAVYRDLTRASGRVVVVDGDAV